MKRPFLLLALLSQLWWCGPETRAAIVVQPTSPRTNAPAPAVATNAPAEALPPDVLEFLNGDGLHGTFISIDAKRGLRWQHPAIKQPLEIQLGSLARIKLGRPKTTPTNSSPSQLCSVRLVNDDELLGRLVGLDETKVTLETWYGGPFAIARKAVATLSPTLTNLNLIYEGPTSLDGWKFGRTPVIRRGGGATGGGAWRYNNGAFLSVGSGTIGRDFQYPGAVSIDFDLIWRGYLQFSVSVFADSLETYGGNAYLFQISQGVVYCQRMTRDGGANMMSGSVEVPNLAQRSKARISIRANREQKTLALLADGALIKTWSDRGEFSPGSGLVFAQHGQGITSISNIRISDWDGRFDDHAAPRANDKEDAVQMTNRNVLSGTLRSIKDDKMSFATAFAALDVPLSQIAQITLRAEKAAKPEPTEREARLFLHDRGAITLQIDRWDDQAVLGVSPSFGQLKLNPAAFSVVQFNLDKQKTTDLNVPDIIDSEPLEQLIIEE
jgi:hypothetical protein